MARGLPWAGMTLAVKTRLSQADWVHDADARFEFTEALMASAERLSMHGDVTARAIGRCRCAVIPGLVDWLASELRNHQPPKRMLLALSVAHAAMIAELARLTLLPERVKQLPELSGQHLAAYLEEELAS